MSNVQGVLPKSVGRYEHPKDVITLVRLFVWRKEQDSSPVIARLSQRAEAIYDRLGTSCVIS